MDRIEFRVETQDLPVGAEFPRVVPAVNGVRVDELVAEATGDDFGGLTPDVFLTLKYRDEPSRRRLFGCCCGDPDCSWVTVDMKAEGGAVVWRNVMSSRPDQEEQLASLGPFTFDRVQFAAALEQLQSESQ